MACIKFKLYLIFTYPNLLSLHYLKKLDITELVRIL